MSDEKITIDLLINSANSAQTLGEVKKSIKDITKELQNTAVGTAEYNKLAIALGKSKAEFMDFKQQIKAFDPDAKFGAFAKIGSGIAGSFQAATGAMALFGVESEEVQKTLLKVQAATALAQGIKSVEELGDSFKILNTIIKANPILAVASALIALGGILYAFKDQIFGVSEAQEELNKELEKQHNITEALKKSSQQQIELLQAQGASEEKIIEVKKKLVNQQIAEVQASILVQENKLKESFANDTLYESATRLLGGEAAYQILKIQNYSEQAKKIQELKIQKEDLSHSIEVLNAQEVVIEKKKNDELNKNYKTSLDEKKKLQQESDAEFNKLLKGVNDEQKIFDDKIKAEEELQKDKEYEQQLYDEQKLADEKKKIRAQEWADQKTIHSQKLQLELDTLSALKDLNDAFGGHNEKTAKRAFEVSKALSIAQTIISTVEGAQNAFQTAAGSPLTKVFPAYPFIQSALAYAKGLAAVQKIRSQKYNSSSIGGDGGGTGGGSIGGGNGVPLNPVTNNSTLLNPDGTPVNNNPNKNPVKAYVVETEITQSQNKIKSIENKSKFE